MINMETLGTTGKSGEVGEKLQDSSARSGQEPDGALEELVGIGNGRTAASVIS